jgi:hypothetical protein
VKRWAIPLLEISGLPRGRVTLSCWAGSKYAPVKLEVEAGTQDLSIVLRPRPPTTVTRTGRKTSRSD